jgi:outer membrane murein-binding lipoprotein Lpp
MKKRMKTNKNHKRQNTEDRIQDTGYRFFCTLHPKPYTLNPILYALFLFLFLLSGCSSANKINKLKGEVDSLIDENAKLKNNIEQLTSENEQLKKQNSILQSLPDNAKGVNLYKLENVKLNSYSGLFDENNDGKLDTLIVRLQPIDNFGDITKVSASVEVELWNLNKPENQALIGKWNVGTDELKKKWVSMLMTNYRLSFDISGKIDKLTEPLTLKVTFTDYLSGRVFNVQKVIEP